MRSARKGALPVADVAARRLAASRQRAPTGRKARAGGAGRL